MTDEETRILNATHDKLLQEWKNGAPVKPLFFYALDNNYFSENAYQIIHNRLKEIAVWRPKDDANKIKFKALALILYHIRVFFESGNGNNIWDCLKKKGVLDARNSVFGNILGLGSNDSETEKTKKQNKKSELIKEIVSPYEDFLFNDTILKELGTHDKQKGEKSEEYRDWMRYHCPFLQKNSQSRRLKRNEIVMNDPTMQDFLSMDWADVIEYGDMQLAEMISAVAQNFVKQNERDDAPYPDSISCLGLPPELAEPYIHALFRNAPVEYILSLKALESNNTDNAYSACIERWPWLKSLWGAVSRDEQIKVSWYLHKGDGDIFYPCFRINYPGNVEFRQKEGIKTSDKKDFTLKALSEVIGHTFDDFEVAIASKELPIHNPFKSGCVVFRYRKGYSIIENGSQAPKRICVLYQGDKLSASILTSREVITIEPQNQAHLKGLPYSSSWKIAIYEQPSIAGDKITWRFTGEFGEKELALHQKLKLEWTSSTELNVEGENCEVFVGDKAYFVVPEQITEIIAEEVENKGDFLQLTNASTSYGQIITVSERTAYSSHRDKILFLPDNWEELAENLSLEEQLNFAKQGLSVKRFFREDGTSVNIISPLLHPLWYWNLGGVGESKPSQEILTLEKALNVRLCFEWGGMYETTHVHISSKIEEDVEVPCCDGYLDVKQSILEKCKSDTLFSDIEISHNGTTLCRGRHVPVDTCITTSGRLYVPLNKRAGKSIVLYHERHYFQKLSNGAIKGVFEKKIPLGNLRWDGNNTTSLQMERQNWSNGYIFAEIDGICRELILMGGAEMQPLNERISDISISESSLMLCSLFVPDGNLKDELVRRRERHEWVEKTEKVSPELIFEKTPQWVLSQIGFAQKRINQDLPLFVMKNGFFRLSPESDCVCKKCAFFQCICRLGQDGLKRGRSQQNSSACSGSSGIALLKTAARIQEILGTLDCCDFDNLRSENHDDLLDIACKSLSSVTGLSLKEYCKKLSTPELATISFAANWVESEIKETQLDLNPTFQKVMEIPQAMSHVAQLYVIFKTITLL